MKNPQKSFSSPSLMRDNFLLAFLFLVLRFGGLLWFHPFYNDTCPLEEYYRGTLAHELLRGLSMPYWEYRPDNFAGGSLVVGVLAAGFFKLLGSSAFVLRSLPVLISLAALLLWFRILYRECSRKCAWYFGLFFVFAPSTFQMFSMVPLGDHYETIFLSALAVTFFLRLRRNSNALLSAFLFGLTCGFGIWFAYIFALSFLVLLGLWLYRNPRLLFTRTFRICTAGFLAGFSPWIWLNLQTNFQGLLIHGESFGRHLEPIFSLDYWRLNHWDTFFFQDLFSIFSHPDIGSRVPPLLINSLYAFLLITPVVPLFFLRLYQQSKVRPFFSTPPSDVTLYFLIYTALHCAAIQLTDFSGVRYMMPLMPSIFFIWAKMIEALESFSPTVRKATRILFASPLLGLGAFLWFSMISPTYAGLLLKTPGYAYDVMPTTPLCDSNPNTCQDFIKQHPEKISSKNQAEFWTHRALQAAEACENQDPTNCVKALNFPDPLYEAVFYFHFGRVLFQRQGGNLNLSRSQLRSLGDETNPAFKLYRLGMYYAFGNSSIHENINILMDINPGPDTPAIMDRYFRALGKQISRLWWSNRPEIEYIYVIIQEAFSDQKYQKEREAFIKGTGSFFVRTLYKYPILGAHEFAKVKFLFSPEDQKPFFEGVGRAYQISRIFFPAPCRTWNYRYMPEEKDPTTFKWIEDGKQEIQALINEFLKQYARQNILTKTP